MRTLTDQEVAVVSGGNCTCGCPTTPPPTVCTRGNPGNDKCVGNAIKFERKFEESPGNSELSGTRGASN